MLVVAVMFSMVFVDAFAIESEAAAARKVTTGVVRSYKQNDPKLKKVPAVKKGTTRVTQKKQHALVKFTAPQTKAYTFTVSNVSDPSDKSNIACGHYYILKDNGRGYLESLTASTQGGKNSTLRIATPQFLNNWNQSGSKSTWYLKSRYGKVKLKKGETVYLDVFVTVGTNKKSLYTLNIK